jgi:FkbM family methyltransferase
MGIGAAIEQLALRVPRLTHLALWSAARIELRRRRDPHWLFLRLARQIDYRAPVLARLGNGMKMQVPWIDVAGREIYETGWYEPETVQILSALLRPGMVVLDVGASIGQYTLLASGIVGATGKVHAFEPDPVTYQWLSGNVKRNNLENVTTNQLALGGEPGALDLYIGSPENIGTTSLRPQYNHSGRSARVDVLPLDDYLERAGVDRVDFIKIDVEGAESLVFKGAKKLLAKRPTMIIEFEEGNQKRFDTSCAELARILLENGYKLESILDGKRVPYDAAHPAQHYTFNVLGTSP